MKESRAFLSIRVSGAWHLHWNVYAVKSIGSEWDQPADHKSSSILAAATARIPFASGKVSSPA